MLCFFIILLIAVVFYPLSDTTTDYLFLYIIEMSHFERVVYIGLKDCN